MTASLTRFRIRGLTTESVDSVVKAFVSKLDAGTMIQNMESSFGHQQMSPDEIVNQPEYAHWVYPDGTITKDFQGRSHAQTAMYAMDNPDGDVTHYLNNGVYTHPEKYFTAKSGMVKIGGGDVFGGEHYALFAPHNITRKQMAVVHGIAARRNDRFSFETVSPDGADLSDGYGRRGLVQTPGVDHVLTKAFVSGHMRTNPTTGFQEVVQPYNDSREPGKQDYNFPAGAAPVANIPITPEEDWNQNGVRSQSFSNWFGDWQNDPQNASQVTGQDGPQQVYPTEIATGRDSEAGDYYQGVRPGGDEDDEPHGSKPGSPYGKGYYYTDDEDVGSTIPPSETDHQVPQAVRQDVAALVGQYLQAHGVPPDPDTQQLFATRGDIRALYPSDDLKDQHYRKVLAIANQSAGRGPGSVYLNMRNPISTGAMLTPDMARIMMRNDPVVQTAVKDTVQARTGIHLGWETMITAGDVFDAMKAIGRQEDIPGIVEEQGYDGIIGDGKAAYGDTDHTHKVYVAFKPGQVKSTSNRGTFDSRQLSLMKSVTGLR